MIGLQFCDMEEAILSLSELPGYRIRGRQVVCAAPGTRPLVVGYLNDFGGVVFSGAGGYMHDHEQAYLRLAFESSGKVPSQPLRM